MRTPRQNYPTTAPEPLLYTEYINLAEQWQNTSPAIYKPKIRDIAHHKGIKVKDFVSALNLSKSLANSMTTTTHPSKIEFLMALRIADLLQCNVKDFL